MTRGPVQRRECILRRSRSEVPAQTPGVIPSVSKANERHSGRTGHEAHTSRADAILRSPTAPFSGKNTSAPIPRHAARECQAGGCNSESSAVRGSGSPSSDDISHRTSPVVSGSTSAIARERMSLDKHCWCIIPNSAPWTHHRAPQHTRSLQSSVIRRGDQAPAATEAARHQLFSHVGRTGGVGPSSFTERAR